MTRAVAIRKKCLDCVCNIPKEVTLCHIFDCPLWEFRFGSSLKSKTFTKRMNRAKERYPKEVAEIKKTLLKDDMDCYLNIRSKPIKTYIAAFYGINSKKTYKGKG